MRAASSCVQGEGDGDGQVEVELGDGQFDQVARAVQRDNDVGTQPASGVVVC
ncbi:hypothetical protein [Streptomyces kaniharaensis]|uniref:hypothetical protein n=1 Tax=Streptomyces kaniharaensis TaxID=212423 RepID=UPI00129814BC|nr:hypothetical protein [Streptomyces kaniharaensis]